MAVMEAGTFTKRTKPKYIRLDGIDLLPRGPVQFEMTNIHQRKVSMGDPGPDSHPTNSTITQHSWEGGGQIGEADPASDMMRFDWATMLTEYPHFLTLPPKTYTYGADGQTFSFCLGDYPFGDAAEMHFQIGNEVKKYNAGTDSLTTVTTMTVSAANKGAVYRVQTGASAGQIKMFIPGRGSGYDIYNGTTVTNIAGLQVVDFAVWDNKLFALDTTGKLWWATDPMTAPAGWTNVASLADGSDPRRVVNYVNRADADTLYVITNSAVWGLDFTNARLVKSYFSYPRHPRQGWGAEHWRGELWTSVGQGAHTYDLNQVTPRGIDRDSGTPPQYRGYVTDIVGSYNDLFMYIKGTAVEEGGSGPEEETLDVGGGDDTIHASSFSNSSNNLIASWNGIGFHYRWAGVGVNPGNMYVSQANTQYNLWWANDGKLLKQMLPIDYFNPADPFSPAFTHEESGEFYSPWYDWGWPDQVKLLKRLEFGVRTASATEYIEIFYKLDEDTNPWISLATITGAGRHAFPVGLDTENPVMPDGSPCYIGEAHNQFKIKMIFHRDPDDDTKRPVLDWWSAVGRKVLNPIRTWRFSVDLTKQSMRNYPGASVDFLQTLAQEPRAIQFDIMDESYMVEVVALAGPKDVASQEKASFVTVHLLEANDILIPLP